MPEASESEGQFVCPYCEGRVYRSSRGGKQVYKCNDLRGHIPEDCVVGHQAVGRTKPQVRRADAEIPRGEASR